MKLAINIIIWIACLPFVATGLLAGLIYEALQWGFVGGRGYLSVWVESKPTGGD